MSLFELISKEKIYYTLSQTFVFFPAFLDLREPFFPLR
jgi:hypothetical protein